MSTDAERREATDQWTVQLREQQIRELRAQLATVTAERDAWKQEADDERKSMRSALRVMQERAETAEAKLKEWETAANNNDPYITNGGYVEVEVLEAVKRRNAELLARAEAAEASINEWTARRKPIPLDALLAIEEIAPLIGYDKLSDPAAWMKAWDQVSPWLAALNPDKEETTHE